VTTAAPEEQRKTELSESPVEAEPAPSPARVADAPSDVRWVLVWTAIGLAIRAIHALWLHPLGDYLWSDMGGHFYTAQRFAAHGHVSGRMDVIKPRAMSFVGGLILHQFGQGNLGKQMWGLLQVLLSTATLPLAFVGARRFFGRRSARIAIVVLALDALSISFAGFLMVETYAMFCLALTFALLDPERPWRTLWAGAALGLAGLFKPQILLVVPLWCLLLLLWPSGPAGSLFAWLRERRRVAAVLLGVGVLAVVLPETIAVSRIVGRPTLLSAYSGQNFYVGHCNVMNTIMTSGPGDYFTAGVPKVYERNEPWPDVTFKVSVFDSDFYFREGMKCWRKSFWASALWSVEQLADVFAGWPGSTIDPFPIPGGWGSLPRYFGVTLEYLFVPLAFMGLWQWRRELGAWVGFGAPMGSIWGLALVFSGDPRYREPFDVFIVAAAAGGLGALIDRFKPAIVRWIAARLAKKVGDPRLPNQADVS